MQNRITFLTYDLNMSCFSPVCLCPILQ